MPYFERIATGLDVSGIVAEVADNPQLWNAHKSRTQNPASAHYGVDDLWLRFRAIEELTSPEKYGEPHFAVSYPAWKALPSVEPLIHDLIARTKSVHLGGVMITRIPAGGQVKPHHDRGGWHAQFFTTKLYVPLMANPDCVNYCGTDSVVMQVGECWKFDNLVTHSVVNQGKTDRMTLIVCLKGL